MSSSETRSPTANRCYDKIQAKGGRHKPASYTNGLT